MKSENIEASLSQLVREALEGSQRAWNLLVERFQKRVFTMALVVTKDIHDADDVTQNVFVALFKNLKTIRKPEVLEGWLIRTAINKARDLRRRRRIREWLPLSRVKEAEPSTAEQIVYSNELKQIFEAWKTGKLSEKEQLVFQLRFGEERTLQEIAEILGMKINTIKTHLHRAMLKLRPEAKRLIKGNNNDK